MNKILLLGSARESSFRCPNKLLRKFNDTNMFTIYMDKLQYINDNYRNKFSDIIIAISDKDKGLWDIANTYNIKIQNRSEESSKERDWKISDIHYYLKDYKQYFVLWVNASFPLLRVNTIIDVIDNFNNNKYKSMHLVKRRYNWFWENGLPINIEDKNCIRTTESRPIYESVHAMHIYNRKYMLENNAYWDFTYDNPHLYEVEDSIEFLDVDTEFEFSLCEDIYERRGTI
jgi:CMP-N-acetylneuraminic acid synthetase